MKDRHASWKSSGQINGTGDASLSGEDYSDTVSFGGVLTVPNANFSTHFWKQAGISVLTFTLVLALIDDLGLYYTFRMNNGHLGLYVDPSAIENSTLGVLWNAGVLMNPVMGLRMDPKKPRLTIGA